MYINNVEFFSVPHPHTPHSNTRQQLHSTAIQHSTANTAQPFTRVCLEFLTTVTCRALYGKIALPWTVPAVSSRLFFNHFDFQKHRKRITLCQYHLRPSKKKPKKMFFSINSLYNLEHHRTIQYLIPGWMTIVKIAKTSEKIGKVPSRDPWSNCLINFPGGRKNVKLIILPAGKKTIQRTICGPSRVFWKTCPMLLKRLGMRWKEKSYHCCWTVSRSTNLESLLRLSATVANVWIWRVVERH